MAAIITLGIIKLLKQDPIFLKKNIICAGNFAFLFCIQYIFTLQNNNAF